MTKDAGFSLIELLVVIAITTMLTGLMLINMRTYTDYTELEGEAYKIATLAREAQTYAISTKTTYLGIPINYQSVGLYFSGVPGTRTVTFFGEINPNGKHSADDVDIPSKSITLMPGYSITKICGNGNACGLNNASITYLRPFVSASITSGNTSYGYIDIELTSPKLNTRHVQLWTTGQVTVK